MSGKAVIICGDMNVARHEQLDMYRAKEVSKKNNIYDRLPGSRPY